MSTTDPAEHQPTAREGHVCDTGHFDRTICPGPCGTMHSYCATCGERQDACAHEAQPAPVASAGEVRQGFVLRVPTDREPNDDGALNRGRNYVDVQVVIQPDLDKRGEHRPGYGGSVIALREWNEQVFLHELLHAATAYSGWWIDPQRQVSDPHGHDVISRIEVALWETGWRYEPDLAVRLAAAEQRLAEAQAEALREAADVGLAEAHGAGAIDNDAARWLRARAADIRREATGEGGGA